VILKFLASSLQHVSVTFSGEISLFRSHKRTEFLLKKAVFKCTMIMLPYPMAARLHPDPVAERTALPQNPLLDFEGPYFYGNWIGHRREGDKEEGWAEWKMEEKGREERKKEKEGMGACTHRNFRKSTPMISCYPAAL